MIKHIVLFDIDEKEQLSEYLTIMNETLSELMTLVPGFINGEALRNADAAPQTNHTLALSCEYESFAALDTYQKHAVHIAMVQKLTLLKNRVAIDYEY